MEILEPVMTLGESVVVSVAAVIAVMIAGAIIGTVVVRRWDLRDDGPMTWGEIQQAERERASAVTVDPPELPDAPPGPKPRPRGPFR